MTTHKVTRTKPEPIWQAFFEGCTVAGYIFAPLKTEKPEKSAAIIYINKKAAI